MTTTEFTKALSNVLKRSDSKPEHKRHQRVLALFDRNPDIRDKFVRIGLTPAMEILRAEAKKFPAHVGIRIAWDEDLIRGVLFDAWCSADRG